MPARPLPARVLLLILLGAVALTGLGPSTAWPQCNITISPGVPVLDFGTSVVGDDSVQTLWIEVSGNPLCTASYEVSFTNPELELASGSSSVSQQTYSGHPFQVRYRRSQIDTLEALVVIHSLDAFRPDVDVPVHGVAAAPGHLVVGQPVPLAVSLDAGTTTTTLLRLANDGGFGLDLSPWATLDPDPAGEPLPGASVPVPVVIQDGAGFRWDLGPHGELLTGTDSDMRAMPVDAALQSFDTARLAPDGLSAGWGPSPSDGCILRRHAGVSPGGGYAWFLDEIHNPTSSLQIWPTLLIYNFDPLAGTWPFATATGAPLPGPADAWYVMPGRDTSTPSVLVVQSGAGASVLPGSVFGPGTSLHWSRAAWGVPVPPNETRELLTFIGQGRDPEKLTALGAALAAGDSGALDGIPPADLTRIVNLSPPHAPLRVALRPPRLEAGGEFDLPLTVDATVLAPGAYTGHLRVGYSMPNGEVDVPLAIEITGAAVGVGSAGVPLALSVRAPEPNPARVSSFSAVMCTLPHAGEARLAAFDVHGREVAAATVRVAGPGTVRVRLPGMPRPPGIYFLQLTQGAAHAVAKVVVLP